MSTDAASIACCAGAGAGQEVGRRKNICCLAMAIDVVALPQHKMAVVCTVVVIFLYIVCLFCEFFATMNPEQHLPADKLTPAAVAAFYRRRRASSTCDRSSMVSPRRATRRRCAP